MKQKIVFILGALLFVNVVYSEYQYCPVSNKDSGYVHNGQLMPKCTENDSPEIWSGSWEDLQIISAQVEAKFEFETRKHLGRNIASLVPSSLQQMKEHIQGGGQWGRYVFDAYHEPKDAYHELKLLINPIDAILMGLIAKTVGGRVEKYTNLNGDEVVYDKESGKIILDKKMGTKNFGKSYEWIGVLVQNAAKKLGKYYDAATILRGILKYIHPDHNEYDVKPHKENDQYKYAGILFERGIDGKYYIIDGQTGKRMTKKQVEDFPTTFSDMWKDKGLVCVESDAIDIVPPKENRQSAQNASSEDGNDAGKDETLPVIDTTRLEVLLKNRISLLSRIVAAGRKITEEENRKENSLLDSVMTELASLVEIISLANVSDDKKIKMLDDIANRCMPYVEKISGLLREAEAKGIATIKTGNINAKLQENVRKIRNSTGKISND